MHERFCKKSVAVTFCMRFTRDFICTIQKFNFFAGISQISRIVSSLMILSGTNFREINQNLQNSRNLIPPKDWFPYRHFVCWAFHFPWLLCIIAFSFQKLLVNMNMHTNLILLRLMCKWWRRKKLCIAFYTFVSLLTI